jgi:hypothetical protein
MNKSYSKIRHIQESNERLENRLLNEQVVSNVGQLVKDVIGFIWGMNIIPGPIDGGKLLYDLYKGNNAVKTIKDFVRGRIPTPKEDWLKIEKSLDRLGNNLQNFKSKIYSELKNKIG